MRVFCCLLLMACGRLPEPYLVRDLRIIGMVAEPPEIAAGSTSVVTVYFFDPDSDGRAVSAFDYTCADAKKYQCLIAGETPARQSAAQDAARVQTDMYTTQFSYTAPADIFDTADARERFYGRDGLVLVRGDNGQRHIDGQKRVVVSAPANTQPKNTNPVFRGFYIEDNGTRVGHAGSLDALNRAKTYQMRTDYDASSLEHYFIVDYNQQVQQLDEEASFVWSCSPSCKIDQPTSFGDDIVNITTPTEGAPSGRFSIQVVMRDGRGGAAVFVRSFSLLAAVAP